MPEKHTRASLLKLSCKALEGGHALDREAVELQLGELPQWRFAGGFISREYAFQNYYETLAFVNALAWIVHREDHHPELNVTYNKCTVRFNTHSVGGISLNDFICAAHCDALLVPVSHEGS